MMNTFNPCRRLCRFSNDICTGCGRTLDEAKNWQWSRDEEKHLINNKAKQRLKKFSS